MFCCSRVARGPNLRSVRHAAYITSPLISDPFKFDNTRKIRDTNTVFPRPNFLSFDAFGTLYVPKKPVAEQYYEVASQFGVNTSVDEIQMKFPHLHRKLLEKYPNYGKGTAQIADPNHWWSELIVELFGLPHFSADRQSAQLCEALVHRFASGEAYALYEDVVPALEALQAKGIRMVVSSNSDSRALDVLASLGLKDYFDQIYLSYDVDHEKPSRKFFDVVANSQIAQTVGAVDKQGRIAYLENCWHVGDGHENDFLGAVKAGWNGIYLDRSVSSKYLTTHLPDPEAESPSCMTKPPTAAADAPIELIANNRIVLSDLRQLAALFE